MAAFQEGLQEDCEQKAMAIIQPSLQVQLRTPSLQGQPRTTQRAPCLSRLSHIKTSNVRHGPSRRSHLPVANSAPTPEGTHDPLRDGPLRYLGYANEVGEAFGTVLSRTAVNLTYAVSIAYVIVDTFDKTKRALESVDTALRGSVPTSAARDYKLTSGIYAALDCFLWQMLASVALPGLCIHKVVHVASAAIEQGMASGLLAPVASILISMSHCTPEVAATVVTKALPTLIGLVTIPLIIHPIDSLVDAAFNASLRLWFASSLDGKRRAVNGLDGGAAAQAGM